MATQSTTSIRRVRRTSGSSTDIFPLAVLPIVGLPIVFILGLIPFAEYIQAVNLRTTTHALEQAELPWVKVEADGQWILLSGTPPTAAEGEQAIAISRAAMAPHLFGSSPPATRVEAEFAQGVTSVVPQPAPRLDSSPYAWAWRLSEGVLTLTGQVARSGDPRRGGRAGRGHQGLLRAHHQRGRRARTSGQPGARWVR